MQIELSTSTDFSERLRQSMQRQLEYKLASFADMVGRVHAELTTHSSQAAAPFYRCEVTAVLADGSERCAITQGQLPNICIADAASRLARTIARESKFATLHWSKPKVSGLSMR